MRLRLKEGSEEMKNDGENILAGWLKETNQSRTHMWISSLGFSSGLCSPDTEKPGNDRAIVFSPRAISRLLIFPFGLNKFRSQICFLNGAEVQIEEFHS